MCIITHVIFFSSPFNMPFLFVFGVFFFSPPPLLLVLRSYVDVLLGWEVLGIWVWLKGSDAEGSPPFFCKDWYIVKNKKKDEIFVLKGGNIFFNYQMGINSWTLTDLSIKCDEAKNWNHWNSGTRLWVSTSFLLFSLLKSIYFIFYLQERKQKNFCARFWDCRLGCHNLV